MLDFLFLTGQAASALLLLYGGYLAVFSWLTASLEPARRTPVARSASTRSSAL